MEETSLRPTPTPRWCRSTHHPPLSAQELGRVDGGSAPTGSSRSKRWPNLNSIRLAEDSEQPKQRLQGGNDIVVPPPPDPRTDLGFPPVLEAGEHEQGHDNASKKVTAPTGVAVISKMQGFRPGLSTTPKTIGQAHKELPFSTPPARGAQGNDSWWRRKCCSPVHHHNWTGLEGGVPARCRHEQPPAPPRCRAASSKPRLPRLDQLHRSAPRPKTVGNLELDLAGAGTPPPGRGPAHLCRRSAALAARSRSAAPPDPRGTTPPPGGRDTARGEGPLAAAEWGEDGRRRRCLGQESAAGAGGEARAAGGFSGDSCDGRGRGSASRRRRRQWRKPNLLTAVL